MRSKIGLLCLSVVILSCWLFLSMYQRFVRYDSESFNCVDMSNEVAVLLSFCHIPCDEVTGVHLNGTGSVFEAHRWVRIGGVLDFECTTLSPLFLNSWGWTVVDVKKVVI